MTGNVRGSRKAPVGKEWRGVSRAEEENVGSFPPDERITGFMLLLGSAGTVACSVLGRFAVGISEDSGAASFAAYRRHPLPIFLTYGVGVVAGLLFIISAPMLYLRFAGTGSARLRIAAVCQALAGLVLALSASRWLIVFPFLEKQYDNPLASTATRAAIEVDYQTISYFLGITLGENLFAILTGVWTIILAIQLIRTSGEKAWLGWLGIVAGSGWLLGSLEQLDFGFAKYFIIFLGGGPLVWVTWTAILALKPTRRTQRVISSRTPG